MAERSMFWTDGGGDGGPYSQDQLRLLGQVMANSFGANVGVVPGALNGLVVTSTGNNNITVDTGAAIVNGTFFSNDALKSLTTTSPSVGTTGRRVVLEKDWTAKTVRIVVTSSADGTSSIPTLTQTDGTKWQIPLASFTITTAGVIGALTDLRETVAAVPTGAILMWSGTLASIPRGYVLCDGTNGTPNLLARFVKGVATAVTNPGSVGGTTTHAHGSGGGIADGASTASAYFAMSSAHSSASSEPPYYELAFIMRK